MRFFKKGRKIGLALGSGGPRGLAHIGVIKVLVENGIHVDYIAGSSAGAIVGGMYAHFDNIYKVENYFARLTYQDLIKALSDPGFTHGIFKGEKALKLLRSWIGRVRIEKSKIPFIAVATDLFTGETVELIKGDMSMAIRASTSIPTFFQPVKIGRRYLIDGGNSMPVPVEVVKNMGADIIIAVDLDHCYLSDKNRIKDAKKMSMTQITEKSLDILQYNLSKENTKEADIVVTPDILDVGWKKFVHGEDIIREGELATEKVLAEIKRAVGLR